MMILSIVYLSVGIVVAVSAVAAAAIYWVDKNADEKDGTN